MSSEKNLSMRAAFDRKNLLLELYQKTRVLIIEDSAEARGILRGMMRDAEVQQVDVVVSGQHAINSMQHHRYNLVLCDYNLGKGKDGQQVLEEARFNKSLGHACIFIMLTAESSVEMVMGAIEYQPDSYLTKPYTKKDLMTRIDRAMASKIEYKEIGQYYENEKYEITIELCDVKIASEPDKAMRALRIKGECLLKLKTYSEAKTLYTGVLKEREVPWAKIGLGKTLFYLSENDSANDIFKALIKEHPNVIESYDWLAKIEVAQNEPRRAQDTLEAAVARSPKAVLRQMQLARLALSNRSYLVAERSYRKSIVLASNSCYNSPNNYLQYVRTLLVKIDRFKSKLSYAAFKEAKLFLARLRREYENDAVVEFRASMLEALIYFNHGDSAESDQAVEKASKLYRQFNRERKIELAEEYISTVSLVDRIDECLAFVHNLQKTSNHPELANKLLRRVQDGQDRLRCEQLNTEAMALYKKGKLMDAYEKFCKATGESAASAAVLLNALGVCIELAERKDLNREAWFAESGRFIKRLSVLDRCDHRYETYLAYKSRYEAL